MSTEVREGHGRVSLAGGRHGALVIHGYVSSPQAMRGVADALAAAGLTVEVPLLPGHGTSPEDLAARRFEDWLAALEAAYAALAARVDRVLVVGQSMGGALGVSLMLAHPEIAAGVFVNPLVGNLDPDMLVLLRNMIEAGEDRLPAVGDLTADPSVVGVVHYDWTPLRPLVSLMDAVDGLPARLPAVRCPLLIFTSVHDPIVDPWSSDILADGVGGPVERVSLEHSWHLATLDYDRHLIEQRTVEFALSLARA